jgi:hypothetical protein
LGVAEDLALGLMWKQWLPIEMDKTIVYDWSVTIECYEKEGPDGRGQPILIYPFWRMNLALSAEWWQTPAVSA